MRARVEGETRALSVGTDLAAFRILQESLTNVVRHSGATTVTVTLTYRPEELAVEVVDDGRVQPGNGARSGNGSSGGSGIAGMRERATALGGELAAGRRLDGGFRVVARLPLPSERRDA